MVFLKVLNAGLQGIKCILSAEQMNPCKVSGHTHCFLQHRELRIDVGAGICVQFFYIFQRHVFQVVNVRACMEGFMHAYNLDLLYHIILYKG